MIEKVCIIAIFIFLGYIFYKLKIEKRYQWVGYENSVEDNYGVICNQLIYTDRLVPGLQVKYFYEFELTTYNVNAHIKSLNANHRIERNSKYFKRT